MKNTTTKCEDCGKDFPSPEELINHMKKHTGGNIYKCNECPSVFTLKESWRRHSKRHVQETPSVCTVCGVFFQRSDSCTAHMRTHFGKKAHSCEHCHKVSAKWKSRQQIMLLAVLPVFINLSVFLTIFLCKNRVWNLKIILLLLLKVKEDQV